MATDGAIVDNVLSYKVMAVYNKWDVWLWMDK